MKHPSHDQWREEYKQLWPGSSSLEASAPVFIEVQKIFRECTSIDPGIDLGTPVRASCVITEILNDRAPATRRGILAYTLWMIKQSDEETCLFGIDVGALAIELAVELGIDNIRRNFLQEYLKTETNDVRDTYHLAALNIRDWLRSGGHKASPFLYWHFRAA